MKIQWSTLFFVFVSQAIALSSWSHAGSTGEFRRQSRFPAEATQCKYRTKQVKENTAQRLQNEAAGRAGSKARSAKY